MTTPPRLIALCSPAMGSGKSTLADHLNRQHSFVRLAFATPLKAMASTLLLQAGLHETEVFERVHGGRKEEEIPVLGMTSRRLQQLLGTEFGRQMIHEDIWVNITLANARAYIDRGLSVVIDDMRYPNEYRGVIAAGGDCYRVIRPDAPITAAHSSEGGTDHIVMPEVWNTGTREDLFTAFGALLRS